MLYRVVVAFASTEIGSHVAGEELNLNNEQAKGLIAAGYIEAVQAEKLETAEAQITAETADIKSPKRKK